MPFSADDIKRFRTNRNLTQEEFAKKIGITRELLNKMESGKRSVSKATELLIADLLRKELSEKDSHETVTEDPEVKYVLNSNQKDFKDKYIQSLEREVQHLTKENEFLKETLLANLKIADSDRHLIMGQLKALNILEAERFASGNKKTYDDQMAKYRKLVVSDGEVKI